MNDTISVLVSLNVSQFYFLPDGPGMSFVEGIVCPQASQTCCDNDHLDFIDALRLVYFDELHIGLKIAFMVTFSPSSSELSNREYTSYVFELCCLCLGYVVPELPKVSLATPDGKLRKQVCQLFLLRSYKTIYETAVWIRKLLHVLQLFPHVWSFWLSSELRLCYLDMTRG